MKVAGNIITRAVAFITACVILGVAAALAVKFSRAPQKGVDRYVEFS